MNALKTVIYFTFCLILFACTEKTTTNSAHNPRRLSLADKIENALTAGCLVEIGYSNAVQDSIMKFYRDRSFEPVWLSHDSLTKSAKKIYALLNNAPAIGLPASRIQVTIPKKWRKKEVVFELVQSVQFAHVLMDLKTGFIDESKMKIKPKTVVTQNQLKLALTEMDTVQHWDKWFAHFGPANNDYFQLATVTYRDYYLQQVLDNSVAIPSLKTDSIEHTNKTIEALELHSYTIDTTKELSLALSDALKQFQIDHALSADGVNGKYTTELLSESPLHQQKRTLLALEKLRWRSPNSPTYLRVNIPSYQLDYVFNDTLLSTHKVVVGKNETQTPTLRSVLSSIITLPFWTEPYSIASTEFLAGIKRNPAYADKNRLKLFRNGKEVNPNAVNWKKYAKNNFPFTVRQEPGIHNALGLVKFEFANNFSVYIHDTPSKGFFKKDIRAFSHGCMRCEQPDSLARIVLRNDAGQKTIPDSLTAIIARNEHRRINLRQPIPVLVEYITVTVSATNKRVVHVDVYKRDEEFLHFFN
uniref:L,D-transpeptidase family protein n=1 Tax=Fluviicola sp. TaxID=1917219 RepID=UPI00404A16A5